MVLCPSTTSNKSKRLYLVNHANYIYSYIHTTTKNNMSKTSIYFPKKGAPKHLKTRPLMDDYEAKILAPLGTKGCSELKTWSKHGALELVWLFGCIFFPSVLVYLVYIHEAKYLEIQSCFFFLVCISLWSLSFDFRCLTHTQTGEHDGMFVDVCQVLMQFVRPTCQSPTCQICSKRDRQLSLTIPPKDMRSIRVFANTNGIGIYV